MTTKPMFAYDISETLELVTYPKIALPKIDGIRGIVRDGVVPATRLHD